MPYDNTNRFSLFKNDRKETEKHPDLSGTLNVGGVDFWISGWTKEGPRGKFISGSIKPKEPLREAVSSPSKQTVTTGKYDPLHDDDIPF